MALTRLPVANTLSGTIASTNIANASLNAVTALPGAIATGKIGQVLSTELDTYFTTTSATFADVTGVDQTITPSATTSKIFVMITGTCGKDNAANFHFQIVRDTTAIYTTVWDSEHPNTNYDYNFALSILDSPSSTSALDYQLQMKTDSGTTSAVNSRVGSPANRGITNITCWEVLA